MTGHHHILATRGRHRRGIASSLMARSIAWVWVLISSFFLFQVSEGRWRYFGSAPPGHRDSLWRLEGYRSNVLLITKVPFAMTFSLAGVFCFRSRFRKCVFCFFSFFLTVARQCDEQRQQTIRILLYNQTIAFVASFLSFVRGLSGNFEIIIKIRVPWMTMRSLDVLLCLIMKLDLYPECSYVPRGLQLIMDEFTDK